MPAVFGVIFFSWLVENVGLAVNVFHFIGFNKKFDLFFKTFIYQYNHTFCYNMGIYISIPPFTAITCPVMNEAFSEARKLTAFAISFG